LNKLEQKNAFDGSLVFGAKKFQSITGRLEINEKKPIDLEVFEKFGDKKTGRIKSNYLEERPCLCDKKQYREVFNKYGFTYILCKNCGLFFVNPILKDETLMDFYENEQTWLNVLQNPMQQKMDKLKFSYGLDLIELNIQRGTLLDVGSGTGHFMRIANDRGWKSLGIEFNKKEIELSIKEGLEIVDKKLEDPFFNKKKFKLITMWEVLEHLKDPKEIIKRSYELIEPGGLILILVPNRDSLLNRILHEKSETLTPHCHISMFNNVTLNNLLINEGFSILETETVVSELDNISNHLNYDNAYNGETPKALNFLTPEFIHSNMLGCKLLTIAQKV
jgi:SAM-dependent methyltransferase